METLETEVEAQLDERDRPKRQWSKVEIELNNSGRPKRQCAGAGVERLEMLVDNTKEYASVRGNNYTFTMQSKDHSVIRG